jgi:hypothetical protein
MFRQVPAQWDSAGWRRNVLHLVAADDRTVLSVRNHRKPVLRKADGQPITVKSGQSGLGCLFGLVVLTPRGLQK